MRTDYRIQETIHANGQSDWAVEFHSSNPDVWKPVCFVDSKKQAIKYIKTRRGDVIVRIKYHEVPDE